MEDFVVLQEDMVYPIELELDGDFCRSAFVNELVVSTVIGANSNAVD